MDCPEYRLVANFDAPEILSCAVTPIPNRFSAPLQVIASLPENAHRIEVRDGLTNYFIGLYVGPVGEEQLVRIICGPGASAFNLLLKKGSRISLRTMTSDVINSGELSIDFLRVAT